MFDFEDIAKNLSPKERYGYFRQYNTDQEDFLFNYSMKTAVSGNPVSTRLKEIFGDNYMYVQFEHIRRKDNKQSVIDINDIWHVLYTFDSNDKLRKFGKEKLSLTGEQFEKFLKIKPRHEYSSLSIKAINKILPYLREGLIYSHAVFLAKMDEILPEQVWKNPENRKLVYEEILKIILAQSEEKIIIDIINGLVKDARENEFTWSKEAEEIYSKELIQKLVKNIGEERFSTLSEGKKEYLRNKSFALLEKQMKSKMGRGQFLKSARLEDRVTEFLSDNFDIDEERLDKLYHPSAIEVYKPPIKGEDGKYYLGSPLITSVRNPMAMRSLHQLRKIINELIRQEVIDKDTKINIEMARDLMNANERRAYQEWQRDRENLRKKYAERIREYYLSGNSNEEPSQDDILKYQLWEEQNHKCIYTGKEIAISEFLGSNPSYDIEHTIPRSLSFDNSQENKTLCNNVYNRSVKKNKIPYMLKEHNEILSRIEHWKKRYMELDKQVQKTVKDIKRSVDKETKDRIIRKRHRLRYERDYYHNKYRRFIMKGITEGFKNSQLVDTGIITKYARLYLKTLFDKVYTVKGNTVADFRIIWGLHNEYEKKARMNHIHHCIDAVTIACITKESYERLAQFYHDWEELNRAGIEKKPRVLKPWPSFAEDIKALEDEVLVSHHTPDNLPKQSKKKLRDRGLVRKNKYGKPVYQQGDTVRGSLHQETFYGAIEEEVINKEGEKEKQIRYVVRKPLEDLDDNGLNKIVDERVRSIIIDARKKEKELRRDIENLKKQLSNAEESEEEEIRNRIVQIEDEIIRFYSLPNSNGDPVPIRKVRVYTPMVTNPIRLKKHRDKFLKHNHKHKEHYYVANDGNYMMAIYEGKDDKGNIKRDFEIVNNLEAGEYFKLSVQRELKPQGIYRYVGLVPKNLAKGKHELNLKAIIKTGTMVIFFKDRKEEIWDLSYTEIRKRLYKVIKLSKDGRITFKFHQEARNDDNLKKDYENQCGKKAPKSLTNGESKVNFEQPYPKLLLSPSNFNMLTEDYDFTISPLGELQKI
ncbi:MAG: type II CRISPR RNA-guided endonuclease Cas9 [Bacteroidota bacterium]